MTYDQNAITGRLPLQLKKESLNSLLEVNETFASGISLPLSHLIIQKVKCFGNNFFREVSIVQFSQQRREFDRAAQFQVFENRLGCLICPQEIAAVNHVKIRSSDGSSY